MPLDESFSELANTLRKNIAAEYAAQILLKQKTVDEVKEELNKQYANMTGEANAIWAWIQDMLGI